MIPPASSSIQDRIGRGFACPIWIAAGLCLLVLLANAASASRRNYVSRVWQVNAGLPENSVTAVVQTRDGYLWLGTRGGVARFDGVHFTVFDNSNTPAMQSLHVTCLFESADGTLWIGHETGAVTSYKDGQFRAVPTNIHWRGGKILAIGADKHGDIWLLNGDGDLARLRDGLVLGTERDTVVHLVSMARNPQGGLWIQRDDEVFELNDGVLKPLLFDSDTNHYIQGICASRSGGLWVMADNRVQKWDLGRWTKDLGPAPWDFSPVHTLIETRDGHLAAATVDHGLYLVFPNNDSVHFSRTNGLSSDWVMSLCEDREGNLWVGTANGGLAMLRQMNVTTFSPPDQWQGRAVLSVAAATDGSLWIGTEGAGLYHFQEGHWTNFGAADGIFHRFIWSVTEDAEGRIWAGSWGSGVFVSNGNTFEQPASLENLSVATILHARNGDVFVGTSEGLLRYNAGQTEWIARKPQPQSGDVRALAEGPDGTIWFGTLGEGLGCLKEGTVRQFNRADGLPSAFVQCLHVEDENTLWIGTSGGGLVRFHNGRFNVINREAGLPNDVICSIQDDGSGCFWVGSHGGITRIGKAELNRFADGKTNQLHCLTYGASDGLPTPECSGESQPSSCKTADGRLWFCTIKGLVAIDPAQVQTNHLAPPVLIEEMRVDGHLISSHPASAETVRVPPGRHRIEFSYTGLSFVAPERVRFKYRLTGLETEWEDVGTRRTANYTYIPPGDYVFTVNACNNDGVWNDAGAQQAFTVLPYFWQTWWFRIVGGLLTALAGGGIVWLDARRRTHRKLERLERQRAVEQERSRIARDIHDDLGSHLTRITMLSESARGELESDGRANADINQIYDTARDLTHAMDEIVWAVNPKHDTLESLVSYLEKFALDFLGTAGIRSRLDFPIQFPEWPLTAEVRHNLFLAYKEALNNVVRHAAATEVNVHIKLGEHSFELIVEDNGCGFTAPPQKEGEALEFSSDGNGLKNMVRRLAEIGGRCRIHSTPGKGTQIAFVIRAAPGAP